MISEIDTSSVVDETESTKVTTESQMAECSTEFCIASRGKNCDYMLSRFYLVPERNGQTDGQTDRRTDLPERHCGLTETSWEFGDYPIVKSVTTYLVAGPSVSTAILRGQY